MENDSPFAKFPSLKQRLFPKLKKDAEGNCIVEGSILEEMMDLIQKSARIGAALEVNATLLSRRLICKETVKASEMCKITELIEDIDMNLFSMSLLCHRMCPYDESPTLPYCGAAATEQPGMKFELASSLLGDDILLCCGSQEKIETPIHPRPQSPPPPPSVLDDEEDLYA